MVSSQILLNEILPAPRHICHVKHVHDFDSTSFFRGSKQQCTYTLLFRVVGWQADRTENK